MPVAGKTKLILCPYCGNTQTEPPDRCAACGGFFDSLSIKVTQQAMGPWFIRDRDNPFRPGCTYEVLVRQIEKGKIQPNTIIRGPTTRQFWSVARNVPGVAHRVGYCHACGTHVDHDNDVCPECGELFFAPRLRDQLGLAPMSPDAQIGPPSGPSVAGAGAEPTAVTGGHPSVSQEDGETTRAGSTILRDLRGGQAVTGSEMPATAAPQTPDLPEPDHPHDAMDWMTSTDADSSDDLAATGRSLYDMQGGESGGRPLTTWLLVAMNLVLVAAVLGVVLFVLFRPGDGSPTPPAEPDASQRPADPHDLFAPTAPRRPSPDRPTAPRPTAETSDAPDTAPPAPEPRVRSLYARLYEQALEAERIGELNEAARLLGQIERNAPASEKPADLAVAIERVQHKIDRRELEQMFGPIEPDDSNRGRMNEAEGLPPVDSTNEALAPGRPTIFDDRPPDNDRTRDTINWANRFSEAVGMEHRGELDDALEMLLEIRAQAPADQRPEDLFSAIRRVQAKIAQREGRPTRAPR